ncbi:MAG: site-specific integrase, partial [Betaproteobacteria bacterium]|nr:site-specific integrase [Betaproteobacteria bacterium]
MSGSVHIRTRITAKGSRRFQVRFRRGGRGFPLEHGGMFATRREAVERRNLIAGWLAQGRNPRTELALQVADTSPLSLQGWSERYLASRVDLAAESVRKQRMHLQRLCGFFGGARDPATVTWTDVQQWVAALTAPPRPLAPASVAKYVETLRVLFDFAGVEPNPARDPRVRLPKVERTEASPPPAEHVLALLERLTPARWRLPVVVMEQTAMRIGEVAGLAWGDVDVAGCRFRLRARETKTGRARWVQLPEWLMRLLEDTCPPEDRLPNRLVFPGASQSAVGNAMARACRAAGIPVYS